VHAACDLSIIVKGEGLSRSQAVTYTGKVITSQKWC